MVERRRTKIKRASALFFLVQQLWIFLRCACLKAKIAKDCNATTSFPLRCQEIFFKIADAFRGKSCRNLQSNHFVISATVPLFDLQVPGLCSTHHAPKILRSGGTEKGCKVGTQETCRANHLQTNIEARLKGVEPRKKKHNYWLVSSNALIFGTIQP